MRVVVVAILFANLSPYTTRAEEIKEPVPKQLEERHLSPLAVGFGNLFVPGLGATFRGQPARGFGEALTEGALFYGGTFNVHEGNVVIDGSVVVPNSDEVDRALIGQTMQEAGLKLHYFNTFYHYQQAAIDAQDTEREKSNPQPLYRGSVGDILSAPFKPKNLSEPLVLTAIGLGTAYLIYDYKTTPVAPKPVHISGGDNNFYLLNQTAVVPFGGALGEEPLFRGFIQRELRGYTHSLWMSVAGETALFVLVHPDSLKVGAFASGITYGLFTEYYHGDLEPSIAAHFWLNVVDGLIAYWTFQRIQGKSTPFQPPVQAAFSFTY